ncbi:hypothetical protein WOLCODRAFT_135000 [Wolfiporia cocos MD-104 SS10]|uniref:GYF domain-containing protein n=1 Tax=Wolfiporia cocos (strain MD-104) TaxID=742152 RepID=A0A2H3J394_WOLCO|nr:hypothetical protein WOLCODRAFT_135000 [Wolfiporia cocos MD-104 SS10]
MTTTTMHFGPEWMRTKGSARTAPSPPLTAPPAPPGTSTYSALVTPAMNATPEKRDAAYPFRYSREEMLRIYKEGGGRGGLGLEVERWEGIVREVGYDPIGLKEMSEGEKKIFAGSLNSEIRRRQSTDLLSPLNTSLGDRPKLNHTASGAASPMRERIGMLGRRRDSTDQPSLPRKLSLTSIQGPLASPRDAALASPRTRIGLTPGFDGVLNESWSSRRRTSESMTKSNTDSASRKEREGTDSGSDPKGPDIKEEDEDAQANSEQPLDSKSASANKSAQTQGSGTLTAAVNGAASASAGDELSSEVASMSLGQQSEDATQTAPGVGLGDSMAPKPPGLTEDPSSVEWSYLDPQGQVQGPFRADVMQRWHDEGYFNAELLMKRTHLDTEWTSVGDMRRRAGNSPIFLTPGVTSALPPGLPRRPDPLLDGPVPDRERASLYQPQPTTTLRGPTLDTYLHNGSSASASPSSSFGAGRFVNGSPTPSAFEGRAASHVYTDTTAGPRLTGLGTISGSPITPQRRQTFNDPFDTSSGYRSPFTNHIPGRASTIDGLGFNHVDGSADPFTSPFANSSADLMSPSSGSSVLRGAQDASLHNGQAGPSTYVGAELGSLGGYNGQVASRVVNRDVFGRQPSEDPLSPMALSGSFVNSNGSITSNGQPLAQNQPLQYSSSQDGRSLQPLTPSLQERPPAAQSHAITDNQQLHQVFAPNPTHSPAQAQWPPQPSPALRRPGPFDTDYPTSNNTIITGPTTLSYHSFGRTSSISSTDQSPWHMGSSQGTLATVWAGDVTNEAASLTIANLGQHDQQQQQEELQNQPLSAQVDVSPAQAEAQIVSPQDAYQPPVSETTPAAGPLLSAEPSRPVQKSPRRKSGAQPATAAPQPAVAKAAAPNVVKPPSPVPPVEPKAAWVMDDDSKKGKSSSAPLGLREIQEAEMKKAEARKAAERERAARATAAATSSPAEEFQPFTTSWGLPTSQAGAARVSPAAKDAPASSAASPATPVWTNAAKPQAAKKTMKEIQEEEEEKRRRQAAKERETIATAAKRAPTEIKLSPSIPASGGVWTTVGAGGKPTPAAVATSASRPALSTSISAAKIVASGSSASAASTPATPARVPPATAAASRPSMVNKTSSKVDDFPMPPSPEFLKWLGESLKGLNSSVNLEEISSMLLSFPLDPDPSTAEIISDLIYASSTTLDGRRFASEFVSKRKADAASRQKNGVPVSSSAKSVSIADVVKTQPKPAQPEWSGFKVVNKKKKGGRT